MTHYHRNRDRRDGLAPALPRRNPPSASILAGWCLSASTPESEATTFSLLPPGNWTESKINCIDPAAAEPFRRGQASNVAAEYAAFRKQYMVMLPDRFLQRRFKAFALFALRSR